MPEVLTPEVIDSGKRACDAIMLHMMFAERADLMTKWLAISLADGSCDNTLYDSAEDCVKHQTFEQQCWYVCFRGLSPRGVNAKECAIMIMYWRRAYAAGMRFVDPDKRVRAPLMTAGQYDYYDALVKRDTIQVALQKYGRMIK